MSCGDKNLAPIVELTQDILKTIMYCLYLSMSSKHLSYRVHRETQ